MPKMEFDHGSKFHSHHRCKKDTTSTIRHVCRSHMPGMQLPGSQWSWSKSSAWRRKNYSNPKCMMSCLILRVAFRCVIISPVKLRFSHGVITHRPGKTLPVEPNQAPTKSLLCFADSADWGPLETATVFWQGGGTADNCLGSPLFQMQPSTSPRRKTRNRFGRPPLSQVENTAPRQGTQGR